jgi:lysophospholipase L1-like esterase
MLFSECQKIVKNINRPESGIHAGFAVRFARFHSKLHTTKHFATKREKHKILDTLKLPLRFLALGDSYTIGEGVDSDQCWPAQLRVALQRKRIPLEDPIILAQTGWTTSDLLAAIVKADVHGPFDLVTLMIGVNNQYQGLDRKAYQDEFRKLLGLALNFTDGCPAKILGISIPDWGVTPFNEDRDPLKISAEIDEFNHINQTECLVAEITYIDVTLISRFAADDISLLAPDTLHPSRKMYATWVELMLPAVLRILQPQKG